MLHRGFSHFRILETSYIYWSKSPSYIWYGNKNKIHKDKLPQAAAVGGASPASLTRQPMILARCSLYLLIFSSEKFNSSFLSQSGCLYVLLGCILPCVPVLLLRQEARERYIQRKVKLKYHQHESYSLRAEVMRGLSPHHLFLNVNRYNIEGDTLGDVASSFCCTSCVQVCTSKTLEMALRH